MARPRIVLRNDSEEWYKTIFEKHYEEARQRALSLIEAAEPDENGCLCTDTKNPRKVRFRGGQDRRGSGV